MATVTAPKFVAAPALVSQELAQAWRTDAAIYARAYCEENVYRLLACAAAQHGDDATSPRCLHAFCASFGADIVSHPHAADPTAASSDAAPPTAFAVLITSRSKAVAMWKQRASPSPSEAIFWDYHVIPMCLLTPSRGSDAFTLHGHTYASPTLFVFDLDSRLPFPCPAHDYLQQSFQAHASAGMPLEYAPVFRLVPAGSYLTTFASDRRHMRKAVDAGGSELCGEGAWLAPPPLWPCIRGSAASSEHTLDAMLDVTSMGRDAQLMNLKAMMRFVQSAAGDRGAHGGDETAAAISALLAPTSAATDADASKRNARRAMDALLDP